MHRGRYDFKQLIAACPELASYVSLNIYQDESVDFFNPEAVKMLNKALLKQYYGIDYWDIPSGYLCPPIPGRADYIHYVADLLGSQNGGKVPLGPGVKCLDIGVGSSAVYPIIGIREYGWSFVGTDIDPVSIESSKNIIYKNPILQGLVEIRVQPHDEDIFRGVIQQGEHFDLTICNPPFHASLADAQFGSLRKLNNLKEKKHAKPILNFGGQPNELWCEGGERVFVANMILQSKAFASSVMWFSTLISKQSHLKMVYAELRYAEATDIKTFPMGQGQKSSRMVAWTFLTKEEQKMWQETRWKESTNRPSVQDKDDNSSISDNDDMTNQGKV
jgi:23S rRNA (adenine1618-N6)-methyltransferase